MPCLSHNKMKPESCYWDEKLGRLIGTMNSKIREYIREHKIVTKIIDEKGRTTHPETPGIYYCLPREGCHQTHTLRLSLKSCTCQHGRSYTEGKSQYPCAHWTALQIFLNRQDQGGMNEHEETHIIVDG